MHVMRKALLSIRAYVGWPCAAFLALAAGCATPAGKKVNVFFPLPPDEPRIQYLTSFGSEFDLGGQSRWARFILGDNQVYRPIVKPYGLATSRGKVYVCDTQTANVAVVDLVKRRLRYMRPSGEAALGTPINIAVDQDGTRYVADMTRELVMIYDKEGGYLGAIGKKGEMKPCGIALDRDRLYVGDLKKSCVRVYAKEKRELLFTVPRDGADVKAKLHSPTNVAVDQQGRIYASDTGGFLVQIYDAEGRHLRGLGEQGIDPGRFALPKGVGVDHEGRVYVVDAATAVVQLFDSEGRLLMFFGEPKSSGPAALYLPAGLAIDYENVDLFQSYVAPGFQIEYLILVVSQLGSQKVSVYGFLKKPEP